jgi:hypothetical protein
MRNIVSVEYGDRPPWGGDRPGRDAIHLGRQRREVDIRLDLGKRIAQGVDLLAVTFVGEQVGLDGATGFHRYRWQRGSGRKDFIKQRVGRGFLRRPNMASRLLTNEL